MPGNRVQARHLPSGRSHGALGAVSGFARLVSSGISSGASAVKRGASTALPYIVDVLGASTEFTSPAPPILDPSEAFKPNKLTSASARGFNAIHRLGKPETMAEKVSRKAAGAAKDRLAVQRKNNFGIASGNAFGFAELSAAQVNKHGRYSPPRDKAVYGDITVDMDDQLDRLL